MDPRPTTDAPVVSSVDAPKPPAPLKFDVKNPRHWMQAAIFALALYAAFKGGGTPPAPPVFQEAPAAAK